MTPSEQSSNTLAPDKGTRVRVTGYMGGPGSAAATLVGREGTVERFFVGHIYSVGVALDGDVGIHAFRPEELGPILDGAA